MKIKIGLIIIFYLINSVAFCQEKDILHWDGIPNHKVDTTIGGLKINGAFKNSLKAGIWFYSDGRTESKELYSNGESIQLQQIEGNVMKKNYIDFTSMKKYIMLLEVKNGISYMTIDLLNLTSDFKVSSSETWYSGNLRLLKDTIYGLKKLTDTTLIDKNNTVYPIMFSNIVVKEHELIDQQIVANNDESFSMKKTVYILNFAKKMEFDKNDKFTSFIIYNPVNCSGDKSKLMYSLKSTREDRFIIENNSIFNHINYQCRIDKNLVINGFFNKEGLAEGEWNLFHFPYYNLEDQKETGAFSLIGLIDIKTEQISAPYSFEGSIDLKNLYSKTSDQIADILTNVGTLEYLVGVNQPLKYTKYATFSQIGEDIGLEDKKGYYLFQNIKFKDGKLNSGYIYNPDGQVYDSINLNKDDFGESITKNETFKPFPAHPIAQKVQDNLVKGLNLLFTEAYKQRQVNNAQDWKNISCTQCNKLLTQSTAIVVEGIDCNNVRYPGGGNFCSNKCKFDYEKGYCRNK